MAKKAILDVLESTIGKYVKNLDSESLNVALWNGQIELNSLELNIGAVNAELDRQAAEAPNLALPFRVSGGRFDSLKIDVPWARISSRSVVFRAKGLKIVLEPCHRKSGDPLKSILSEEKIAEQLSNARFHSIKLYDDYRRQAEALKKLAIDPDDAQSASQASFSARLVRRIVENLQVEIEDVHIVFRNHACSAGVILQSLSLVTTDRDGNRTFVDRTLGGQDSFLDKLLHINGFGLYLDEKAPFTISENSQALTEHTYILQPLSFEARLRQSDSTRCIEFPKYLLRSELSRLSIVLLRSQLEQLHKISKSLAPKNAPKPIFPEYRPMSRITRQTVNAWWRYAFCCVRRLKGKHLWVEFYLAFQKRKEYLPLYKRHAHSATSSWMTPLTIDENRMLKEIESDRTISIDGLMTWRSIADAQADLERTKHGDRQKKPSAGYMSSFFGYSGSKGASTADAPPITLTVDEMKELEAVSLEQSEDFELSNDSWLCDLSFELGALQIDLRNANRPVTTLHMGTVNTSFNANADGSLKFDFALSSMDVRDLVTLSTLFPMVLRNLGNTELKALALKYAKTKSGDQELRLSMVAFEMVASPMLALETKKFFSLEGDAFSTRNPQNPILRESLSGSVDLFFDADSGQASLLDGDGALPDVDGQPTFSDQLSSALTEAWKAKNKEKSMWTVDCDIQAPVLIFPESCCHYESTVLLVDFGHVNIAYGNKRRATDQVLEWALTQKQGEDISLDVGNVSLENLGFSVGKAKEILTASGAISVKDHLRKTKPVIEPVSATLSCGILAVPNEEAARLSFFGSFASLSLRASPLQVSDALSVIHVWSQIATKLGLHSSEQDSGLVIIDDEVQSSTGPSLSSPPEPNNVVAESGATGFKEGMQFYVMIHLKRLSLYLDRDKGDGVEAHLVSASASFGQTMEGAIQSRVCMGWFWILDMLESSTPRRQRLVAHSTLPRSADELALSGEYNVLDDIEQFLRSTVEAGASGLADITYYSPGETKGFASDPFASSEPFAEDGHCGPLLKAAFASLYVHWNPRAITVLTSALQEIADSANSKVKEKRLASPRSPTSHLYPHRASVRSISQEDARRSGPLLLKATMTKFEVMLNSVRDDLPLYRLTMKDTSILMVSLQSDSLVDLELGDLQVAAPLSSANEAYHTIVGLSASASSSLLSVKYYNGKQAVLSRGGATDQAGSERVETFADVVISPMTCVYLHAQVMTFVDYVNDGILGALTAQAASTAANAALELASSGNQGNKVFALNAVGFDLILPESALSHRSFVLRTGNMWVTYTSFPHPGGGAAVMSLGEVLLSDESFVSIVEDALHADINVQLHPEDIGTLDDQAMRVDVHLSRASFLLSKEHYAQLMLTLENNVGEERSYLRPSDATDFSAIGASRLVVLDDGSQRRAPEEATQAMTHAGVAFVSKESRMYVNMTLDAMCLEMFKFGHSESLVRIEAIRIVTGMDFIPDQQQTTMRVALHNLICQDKRAESVERQFTHLFDRSSIETNETEVFHVTYFKDKRTRRTSVDMTIGSPRVLLIPDAVSDLVDFVSIPTQVKPQIAVESNEVGDRQVEILDGLDSIETMFSLETQTFSFSLSASSCQIVLVDLGSSSTSVSDGRATAESIVVQGDIELNYLHECEVETGVERKTDIDVHGGKLEAYTAYGFELTRPLQILEPTSFSLFYNLINAEGRSAEIEIRAVTLSDVDITVSMQNVALFEVIATGLTESTEKHDTLSRPEQPDSQLSDKEVQRIAVLAAALESGDQSVKMDTDISSSHSSITDDASSHSTRNMPSDKAPFHWKVRVTLPKVAITLINDLQGLDEPLLRVGSSNVVLGGEVRMGMHLSKLEPLFDAHLNCTLAADYFDSSINSWQELLSKPWEVTFNTSRGVSKRYRTNRLSTTLDIECFPCFLSFSEHLLSSLNGASRMWSTYSRAIDSAVEKTLHRSNLKRKALAASATRRLITSLPYGVENATGMDIFFSVDCDEKSESKQVCCPGFIQYYRFEPPSGNGFGGRRLYGQEVARPKRFKLYVEEHVISIDHIDVELGQPRKVHKFDDGTLVITHLRKEAKSMVLRVGSQVDMINQTMIPFRVSVSCGKSKKDLGICDGRSRRQSPMSFVGDEITEKSSAVGLPVNLLRHFEDKSVKPVITLSPSLPKADLVSNLLGEVIVPSFHELLALVESGSTELVVDTVCSAQRSETAAASLPDRFVVLVRMRIHVVEGKHPFVDITLEPRATLRNSIPVKLLIKTPMPHTFTSTFCGELHQQTELEIVHTLSPMDCVEVFTPGPSLAVSVKCADLPISGGTSDWMKGTWVDLPMVREFQLPEPIRCEFPFVPTQDFTEIATNNMGMPFFIVENGEDLTEASFEQFEGPGPSAERGLPSLPRAHSLEGDSPALPNTSEAMRTYLLTVCNYGVDHTGSMLFEQVAWSDNAAFNPRSSSARKSFSSTKMTTSSPLSAFASTKTNFRISLLPSSRALLRLLRMTMDGENGIQRSQVFRIEDVSICGGGLESSAIQWEDGSNSGFFMYRTLVDSFQSELHIIPEFVVYNASRCHRVVIRQIGAEVLIEPRGMAPVSPHPKLGLVFTLDYLDFSGRAGPLRVDDLKHQLAMVKSIDGYPLGVVPVQTVIGGRDSRLVVKLGEVKFGDSFNNLVPSTSIFERDLVRTRVRWSELHVTLCETKDSSSEIRTPFLGAVVDRFKQLNPKDPVGPEVSATKTKDPICVIRFCQFTIDWQRIFKDEELQQIRSMNRQISPERSQLSLVIHNLQILDKTPRTMYPIVFDSTSSKISFCDLCVRTRGPLDADLVKIDLVDLNLAHVRGVSEAIVIKTSEDFVWKLFDIADRIFRETTAISGIDIGLEWDETTGDYRIAVSQGEVKDDPSEYTAPPSDRLIDVNKARVSPFCLVVSFQRRPQASRYKLVRDVSGAKLVNYFTTRLKFTLDKAELKFARYEGHNIKGPPSRLFEIISAVYVSRMKLKVVSILSAANFQDWKFLAARQEGDDEFVEGDVLRATGNLVGKSADFLAKKVGHGLGGGLSSMTKNIGEGIENASEKVGARALGAGVNSVVSGLGEGIGGTVIGVGTGAGKVLKGAGKGVGQVVGGVTGGFLIAGKGIGKGVSSGDGKAVIAGLADGAASIGNGVGQGVESAVMGAADGVLSVGQGLFSGVKTIGKGIGGAFQSPTKKSSRR